MLILASQSSSRANLLSKAGILFQSCPSCVDENVIKKECWGLSLSAQETSLVLAMAKGRRVSELLPDNYVLCADQMVECEGHWIDKAESLAEAREQLLFLRGKTHNLATSAAIFKEGQVVWQHTSTPQITMRNFSISFLDTYLHPSNHEILSAVGCYQIEQQGLQLFEKIQGDLFTVMGLPMLPILAFLRQVGLVLS